MKDGYNPVKDGHDPVISTERTIHGHGDGIEGGGLCIPLNGHGGGISPDWDI